MAKKSAEMKAKRADYRGNQFLGNLSLITPMLAIAFMAVTKIFGNIFSAGVVEFATTLLEWSYVGGIVCLVVCGLMMLTSISFFMLSFAVSGLAFLRGIFCQGEGMVRAVGGLVFTLLSPLVLLLVFTS